MQKVVDKENDTITYTQTIDDSIIFDAADEKIESLDMEVLKKIHQEDPDNKIIKKAIKNKRKKEKQARKQAREERKTRRALYTIAIFEGLFGKK